LNSNPYVYNYPTKTKELVQPLVSEHNYFTATKNTNSKDAETLEVATTEESYA